MSKYLRCLLFVFLYLLLFEGLCWLTLSSLASEEVARMGAFVSPEFGLLGLLVSQALVAYFFCFLMSRSDSITTSQYVVFGLGLGSLLLTYKGICILVWQGMGLGYLWVVPLVLLQYAGAGWIFAKHQTK